jgi:hypothetical protein
MATPVKATHLALVLVKATPVKAMLVAAGSKPTTKQQVKFAYLAATAALRKNKTLLVGFAHSLKL